MIPILRPLIVSTVILAPCLAAPSAEWQPAKGPLMTRWAKDVSPSNALPEYPRPTMVREEWLSLNGLWDHAVAERAADRPASWDGPILVP